MSIAKLVLGEDGAIIFPSEILSELNWQAGQKLTARLENGAIFLGNTDAAICRAQAMVRRYIPDDAGLADELVTDRRTSPE